MIWAFATTALAWQLSDTTITEPLLFEVEDPGQPGLDPAADLEAALAAWTGRGCAPEFPGASVGPIIDATEAVADLDGRDQVVFTEVADGPEPATGYVRSTGAGVDVDILLDPRFTFVSDADAASPACVDAWSLRAVLLRQLGFVFGLGYSDEPGSVMGFVAAPCTPSGLADDDLAGFAAKWGPATRVICWAGQPGVTAGGLPLDITCEASTDDGTPVDATFAIDGGAETGSASLTLTEEGRTTIVGCATPALEGCSETCATWDFVACEPPRAELEVERTPERFLSATNLTEIPVEGCVSLVEWHLYAGDERVWSSQAWDPELPVDVTGDTLELAVFGPGGTSRVTERLGDDDGGCGCTTGATLPGAFAWLLGISLLRRRGSPRSR